ncbi:MAG: dehydrogenase [Actinomycetota bacterium]|jgi:2,4-dienoyl-CoA reductase-like NADH-dependent reductase (Old Yellow Enzyme family)|nr:dehydrogenase [Actinomycetota bacterium]
MTRLTQVKKLTSPAAFLDHLDGLGVSLPFDHDPDLDALNAPIQIAGRTSANRFAVLPMEGWDGTDDGRPTDLVRRRWQRFGSGGAGLVWGGEAFAVNRAGRANPRQLCAGPSSAADLAELRALLAPQQVAGLQLTHSGRWSVESRPARADPLLDRRRTGPLLTGGELEALADDYVAAARLANGAGFDFVDVKACHGYLLHELLSGEGDLAERSVLMRTIVERVKAEGIAVGVRLSVFDAVPHVAGDDGVGRPEDGTTTTFGFDQPVELIDLLGVDLVCVTAGSPYYSPHVQRPAYFPPSDGYRPPEDPLVGVARLVQACADLAAARPNVTFVASGLTYLQEWIPNVASNLVRQGGAAVVGLGRMALSYPDFFADTLAGTPPDRHRLCRTFSDCTTAPRNGLVSGCWPLDDHYKHRPDRAVLAAAKRNGPNVDG